MRFLNRQWAEGAYDDFTLDLYHTVYLRHLFDVASDLPTSARVFALLSRGMLLAGGALIGARRIGANFKIVLRLPSDAFLELEYEDTDFDASDIEALDAAQACLADEFDVTPGELFEHRILLEPDGEAVIRFKDLKFHARAVGEE